MLATTPRVYAAAVRRYTPGTPEHRVAAARAVLAMQAARAHQAGDYVKAGRALEGLGQLARFGDIDTAAISRNITRDLTNAAGRLTPDARALATGQRVSAAIQTIQSIAGPIMGLIVGAINDPGVTRAWNWVETVLTGRVAPTFTEADLRQMASACGAWNGGIKQAVLGVAGTVQGIAALAASTADAGTQADVRTAMNVIQSLVSWIVAALDTICTNLATVFPPPELRPTCAAAGVAPRPPMASGAEGCCTGLVFDPATGSCKQPTAAPEPAQAARARFITAWTRRRDVEAWLSVGNETQKANARARDASTAAELCAAGAALLTYQNPLPMMPRGAPFTPPPINTSNVLTVAATLSRTASTEPYCFIAVPPEGGCSSPCVGGGSQGGSAGIVALALPAAALLWYMMK